MSRPITKDTVRAQFDPTFRARVREWMTENELRTNEILTIGEAIEYLAWHGMRVVPGGPPFTPPVDTSPQGFEAE